MSLAGCDPGGVIDSAGPVVFGPSDVHVLGTSESIATVRDLEVTTDGAVWVLNSVEPLFIGFSRDGDVVATHGTSGGGPEEFRMPAAFLTGGLDEEVWVFDYIRHSFMRVSEPQAGWAQLSIPPEDVPPGSVRGGMDMMSPTVRTGRLVPFCWLKTPSVKSK